jgi:WD40 repeat protein
MRWDLKSGSAEQVVAMSEVVRRSAVASADGQKAVIIDVTSKGEDFCDTPKLHDLVAGTRTPMPSFGDCVRAVALDPAGTVLATGDADGVVRVGHLAGGEPHLLMGHEGAVEYVAVSPDLRWVASTGSADTLRLWPMPDLSAPPLHTWPYDQLLAKLHSLTNLRAVRDPESSTGWKIDIGPFPGWKEVPTW